jgi:hypothetical protein
MSPCHGTVVSHGGKKGQPHERQGRSHSLIPACLPPLLHLIKRKEGEREGGKEGE